MIVTVRDLTVTDIPKVLDYWYSSEPSFLESMGVDLTKLAPREEFRKMLQDKCQANMALPESKINAQVICVDEKPVGFHTINPLVEGDYGVFHAHIWDEDMRGKGITVRSYLLACKVFMDRFNLKRILFKTPLQNKDAIRVKEKLGIAVVGEEILDFGIYQEGVRAKVFEISKSFFLS
jgi:RimJ/RimL family protein N-acetyltransferase